MDRFIEDVMVTVTDYILNLKSNMDRFIVKLCNTVCPEFILFKIQYG